MVRVKKSSLPPHRRRTPRRAVNLPREVMERFEARREREHRKIVDGLVMLMEWYLSCQEETGLPKEEQQRRREK